MSQDGDVPVCEKLGICWCEEDPEYNIYCKKCRKTSDITADKAMSLIAEYIHEALVENNDK